MHSTNRYVGEYWIANQILAKELHNEDEETLQYTMGLMDKLEKVRNVTANGWTYVDAGIDQSGECHQRCDSG
jgi:vacuolar protein sorting-associated protein VTA1